MFRILIHQIWKFCQSKGDYLFRVVSSAFFYLDQHVYVPNKKAIEFKAGGSLFLLDFQKEDQKC